MSNDAQHFNKNNGQGQPGGRPGNQPPPSGAAAGSTQKNKNESEQPPPNESEDRPLKSNAEIIAQANGADDIIQMTKSELRSMNKELMSDMMELFGGLLTKIQTTQQAPAPQMPQSSEGAGNLAQTIKDDLLPQPVTFFTRTTGLRLYDDVVNGVHRQCPVPGGIVFNHVGTNVERGEGRYNQKVTHFSFFATRSRKVFEFLEGHSDFNTQFFKNFNLRQGTDASELQLLISAAHHVKSKPIPDQVAEFEILFEQWLAKEGKEIGTMDIGEIQNKLVTHYVDVYRAQRDDDRAKLGQYMGAYSQSKDEIANTATKQGMAVQQ